MLDTRALRADLVAALTVASVAVPLSLAIALASDVPPAIGLVTAAVAGIVCGHLHRTIHTQWNGVALTVSGSTAPGVALDLRPVDSERPDGRAMIVDDLPSYALHWWDGTRLISHAETVGQGAVLARYDDSMRGIVRTVAQERET